MKKEKGITLVALIITIIVLIILAAVTIKAAFDSNFMGIATKGTENYAEGQVKEEGMIDNTAEYIEETANNIASAGQGGASGEPTNPEEQERPQLLAGWDADKVYAIRSSDNKTVPVPIGFTPTNIAGEKSVDGGFVIKQDGTENEFVWVPVSNTSEMFGKDKDGNFLGKLYDFGTKLEPKDPPIPLNWTETNGVMSWTSSTTYHEPDIVTWSDNTASHYKSAGIVGITNSEQFKKQLQNEFKAMKESVEKYGGFYIGRYETGDLSKNTVVVARKNEDISGPNWYVQYQKSKTIAQGTGISSSMIWGCQWDAVMKWFLSYEDTKEYVTNSEGANYTGSIEPTGYHSVKNIYDMAGNVSDYTIETYNVAYRTARGSYYEDSSISARAYYRGTGSFSERDCETCGSRSTLIIAEY